MLPGLEEAEPGKRFLMYFSADDPVELIRQVIREEVALELHIEMTVDHIAQRTAVDGDVMTPCVAFLPDPGCLLYIGHFKEADCQANA
jgi:hypothetical protein